MEDFTFFVIGSAIEPYQVQFTKTDKKLGVKCSCPAGYMKQICKHKVNILSGDFNNVINEDIYKKEFFGMLEGSPIFNKFIQFKEDERLLELQKKKFERSKFELVKLFNS